MTKCPAIILGLMLFSSAMSVPGNAFAYGSCEAGHWIEAIIDDGKIIKLEDGSLWEVSDIDTVDSALWLPVSDIVICDDGRLINTDDGEAVDATRIR